MISETKQAVEKKNIVLENKLHNRFDIEVRDAVTGEMKQKAQAFNIILDQFWTRLFANQSVYDYIQYGSGTGTPSASDTALFNWVAGAAASAYVYDDAHYAQGWNSFTRNIVLDEQTAVGVTITEVGLAGATNSGLCTHAMLQDMNGNPITITKTNTDIIIIYATVYIHWNVNGTNGVRYIPSSHWFGAYSSGAYPTIGKFMLNEISRYTGVSYLIPVGNVNTKTWVITYPRIVADTGNVNGIGHMFSEMNYFDIDITGAYQITADAIGTGDGSTVEFSTSFDLPYDATVYVDGVAEANVTVKQAFVGSGDMFAGDYINYFTLPTCLTPCSGNVVVDDVCYFCIRNPWPDAGIQRYLAYCPASSSHDLKGSNDGATWTSIVTGGGVSSQSLLPIPAEHQHYRFYVLIVHGYKSSYIARYFRTTKTDTIVFDTPPAAGAVITADYKTPFLPKDSNHVYDLSLTIQLGEYNNP